MALSEKAAQYIAAINATGFKEIVSSDPNYALAIIIGAEAAAGGNSDPAGVIVDVAKALDRLDEERK